MGFLGKSQSQFRNVGGDWVYLYQLHYNNDLCGTVFDICMQQLTLV